MWPTSKLPAPASKPVTMRLRDRVALPQPADSLAALQRLHPVWFKRPVPWEGFTNLFFQYREQRGRR